MKAYFEDDILVSVQIVRLVFMTKGKSDVLRRVRMVTSMEVKNLQNSN